MKSHSLFRFIIGVVIALIFSMAANAAKPFDESSISSVVSLLKGHNNYITVTAPSNCPCSGFYLQIGKAEYGTSIRAGQTVRFTVPAAAMDSVKCIGTEKNDIWYQGGRSEMAKACNFAFAHIGCSVRAYWIGHYSTDTVYSSVGRRYSGPVGMEFQVAPDEETYNRAFWGTKTVEINVGYDDVKLHQSSPAQWSTSDHTYTRTGYNNARSYQFVVTITHD